MSTEHAGKIAMINDVAQLWGLPPYLTPEGTPASLEEAQVRFMEVYSFFPIIVALPYVGFRSNL